VLVLVLGASCCAGCLVLCRVPGAVPGACAVVTCPAPRSSIRLPRATADDVRRYPADDAGEQPGHADGWFVAEQNPIDLSAMKTERERHQREGDCDADRLIAIPDQHAGALESAPLGGRRLRHA